MIRTSKFYLSFLFILSFPFYLYALQEDSLNTSPKLAKAYPGIASFKESLLNDDFKFTQRIDTGLNLFQHYMCRYHLGNTGLPCIKLVFDPTVPDPGFSYWRSNYSNWMYHRQSVSYFHSKAQYTDARLVIGAKKEQFFSLLHTQNVTKNLNFAVDLRRINSIGYYVNQKTNHNNVSVTSNYQSKNKRYFLLGNAIYNNLKSQENGGISNDSTFEHGTSIDRQAIPVHLNAERRIKNKSIYVKQYFHTGPRKQITTDTLSKLQVIPTSRFAYAFDIGNDSVIYKDPNPRSDFYPAIYRDSVKTYDSIYFHNINNEISWNLLENKPDGEMRMIGLGLFVKHQMARVKQNEIDSAINNVIVRAALFNFSALSPLRVQYAYTMLGNNQGDYFGKINFTQFIKDSTNKVELHLFTGARRPDFMYSRYASNHFFWIHDFEQSSTSILDLKYTAERISLSLGITGSRHINYVYFDRQARPVQLNEGLNIAAVFVRKDFHLNKFTWANNITYQYGFDSSVIRLPSIVSVHSLFYENSFFKEAIVARMGLDVFFNSAYTANAYMPATAQFYLQDKKKISAYPYMDLFLNIKIKTVRAFFKLEHLNSGLMDYNYYAAAYYPMPDRIFKFGISWMFFD